MKRTVLIVIALLLVGPVMADKPAGYPFMTFDKAMKKAIAEDKPLFVYFGRYGCGYCEKTNKEAFSDKQVQEQLVKNYILAYVDAESGKRLRLPSGERITERDVGTRYNAFVTPVFTFMTAEGQSLHRLIGVQRVVDFLSADRSVQKLLLEQKKL